MGMKKIIFGPPGSGKTRHLANRVEATLNAGDTLLVASLTRTAAKEITERAGLTKDELTGTLHSICYNVLGKPKLATNFIKEFNEIYNYNISTESIEDLGQRNDIFHLYNYYKSIGTEDKNMPHELYDFCIKWKAFKEAHGYLDFSDLIDICLERYDKHPAEPDVILYDEAQDASTQELELIEKWSGHTRTTVIAGDDDQSLYQWRGADVDKFLNFSDDYYVLPRTYRLPKFVWLASNSLIKKVEKRKDKEYDHRGVDGYVRYVDASLKNPDVMIEVCLEHCENKESVMILTTCAYMLDAIIDLLKDYSIPFWNPYRIKNGQWNPIRISEKRNTVYYRLKSFLKFKETGSPWTYRELWAWVEMLDRGFIKHGKKTWLKSKKRSTDVVPFQTLRDIFECNDVLSIGLDGNLDKYYGHINEANKSKFKYAMDIVEKFGIEAMVKPNIIVGTIHSVKGGQADHVYLFPDISRSAAQEMEMDSIYRAMYVGMTRAFTGVNICRRSLKHFVDLEGLEGLV